MKVLAIDTSAAHCSAALLRDGHIAQRIERAERRHGDWLLGMMDGLLADARLPLGALDALAYGRGPGSFTGVRIAAAVAQGAAFGAGLPTIGISTLAAHAHAAWRVHGARRVLVAIDARIGELYWGCFEIGGEGSTRALGAERVSAPEAVTWPADGDYLAAGNGWPPHAARLIAAIGAAPRAIAGDLICEARDIATLAALRCGATQPAAHALPVYVRDQVADKPA